MLIVANPDAQTKPPPDLSVSDAPFRTPDAPAAGPYTVPFEILGEPIVPDLTQVPLILQGTFIQLTNTGSSALAKIQLRYVPTVPFVTAPPGGKIKLAANLVSDDLSIFDYTPFFVNTPAGPTITLTIQPNQTAIIGLQYVATGLSAGSPPMAATEAAGNRGVVLLTPQTGASFLATATVRQFFVSQTGSPLVPIAAAAYSVEIGGGPVIAG